MRNLDSFLIAVAGVMLTILSVSVVMYFTAVGSKGLTESVNNAMSSTNSLTEKGYVMYDGQVVNGSVVKYVIDTVDETDFVRVVTKENKIGFNEYSSVNSIDSPNYVDTTDQFVGNLYYNTAGYVVGISFTQLGASPVDYSSAEVLELHALLEAEIQKYGEYAEDNEIYSKDLQNEIEQKSAELGVVQQQLKSAIEKNEQATSSIQHSNNTAIYGSEADREYKNELELRIAALEETIQDLWDTMSLQVKQYREAVQ